MGWAIRRDHEITALLERCSYIVVEVVFDVRYQQLDRVNSTISSSIFTIWQLSCTYTFSLLHTPLPLCLLHILHILHIPHGYHAIIYKATYFYYISDMGFPHPLSIHPSIYLSSTIYHLLEAATLYTSSLASCYLTITSWPCPAPQTWPAGYFYIYIYMFKRG